MDYGLTATSTGLPIMNWPDMTITSPFTGTILSHEVTIERSIGMNVCCGPGQEKNRSSVAPG